MKKSIFILIASLAVVILMSAGCGESLIDSTWKDREIIIDGIDTEWKGARYLIDRQNVTIGLINDGEFLYLRLSSSDRMLQKKILSLGFTVWFDAKGGKKKICGVKFPVGSNGQGMMKGTPRDMQAGSSPPSKEGDDQLLKMIVASQLEISLMGPEKGMSTTMLIADAAEYGFLAKISSVKGNMVYELRVPLEKNDTVPYGIGLTDKDIIGIGFESGKMDSTMRQQMSDRKGGRSGGRGGMGGRGGGMGSKGGRGGGGMSGMSNMFEPFELWLKANMASE